MQKSGEQNAAQTKAHRIGLAVVKTADRVTQIFMDIIFILILLLAVYFVIDTIYVLYHSRADVTMPFKPEDGDFSLLKELSEDCIGWITIDNTSIDYPIMQGVDNYEYLNKDPYGDYSLSGSIYLDSGNASDFSDDYSLVYGHHMSGGFMFGALDDFEDYDYFEDHLTGTIVTERGSFPIVVQAFVYTQASDKLVFDLTEGTYEERVENMNKLAINYNPEAEDEGRLIALSTCRSPTSTRRMILFVRTVEE
jgi:sortase B